VPRTLIGVAGEPGDGGLHLQFGSGADVKIKLQAARQSIALGERNTLRALLDVGAKVEAGSHGEFGDSHVARQQSRI